MNLSEILEALASILLIAFLLNMLKIIKSTDFVYFLLNLSGQPSPVMPVLSFLIFLCNPGRNLGACSLAALLKLIISIKLLIRYEVKLLLIINH
jgi:hypothetical protein